MEGGKLPHLLERCSVVIRDDRVIQISRKLEYPCLFTLFGQQELTFPCLRDLGGGLGIS